jgi:hypothetical protein
MTLRPYSTVRHQKTQKELRSKQPLTCQNSNRVPPEYKFTLLPHQSARSRRSAPLIPKQTTAYDPVHILISHFVTIQLNITLSPSPSTLQNVGTLIVSQTRSRKKVQTWMTVCQICVSRKIKYGIVIRLIPGQGVRILKYGSLPYIRENKYWPNMGCRPEWNLFHVTHVFNCIFRSVCMPTNTDQNRDLQ